MEILRIPCWVHNTTPILQSQREMEIIRDTLSHRYHLVSLVPSVPQSQWERGKLRDPMSMDIILCYSWSHFWPTVPMGHTNCKGFPLPKIMIIWYLQSLLSHYNPSRRGNLSDPMLHRYHLVSVVPCVPQSHWERGKLRDPPVHGYHLVLLMQSFLAHSTPMEHTNCKGLTLPKIMIILYPQSLLSHHNPSGREEN